MEMKEHYIWKIEEQQVPSSRQDDGTDLWTGLENFSKIMDESLELCWMRQV